MIRWLKYRAAGVIDKSIELIVPPRAKEPDLTLHFPRTATGKFLLVVLDCFGDAVMATPTVFALKARFPQCRLTILTRPINAAIFANNPNVDNVLLDEAPWWSPHPVRNVLQPTYWLRLLGTIHRIRREHYDVVIDLRGDLRHILLFGVLTNPKFLLSYSRTGGKRLLTTDIPYDPNMHEIDKKLRLLEPLGASTLRRHPKIWLSDEELVRARNRIAEFRGDNDAPVILMDPGGKPVQRWPVERFARLAQILVEQFRKPVLVSAAPAYSALADELRQLAGSDTVKWVRNLSLREWIALVATCDLVLSCDTGIAHVASAVGTRAVTLFGPTDPRRFHHSADGTGPVQSPLNCEHKDLHEVCSKQPGCFPGQCMMAITGEIVRKAVSEALDDMSNSIGTFSPARMPPRSKDIMHATTNPR